MISSSYLLILDGDLCCVLFGQHHGQRMVGDGTLPGPAVCCHGCAGETIRLRTDCVSHFPKEGLLLKLDWTTAGIYMERGMLSCVCYILNDLKTVISAVSYTFKSFYLVIKACI